MSLVTLHGSVVDLMLSIKNQKGITLIELMIATVILGVVALVALPVYSDYRNRSRFAEAISASGDHQSLIGALIQAGTFTSLPQIDAGTNGVPSSQPRNTTNHGIDVTDGVITVTWRDDGSDLDGVTYTLGLMGATAPVRWSQGGTCGPLGYC